MNDIEYPVCQSSYQLKDFYENCAATYDAIWYYKK